MTQPPPDPNLNPPTPPGSTCPHCGAALETDAKFCEACGQAVGVETPEAPAAAGEASPLDEISPISAVTVQPGTAAPEADPDRAACLQCGGAVDDDGYCTQCGTKAPSARDHFEERPAPWVAGVCDRGIRHTRNEDAMALAVDGERVVLVVCDGVSNTVDSHIGSMNAAHAVLDVLRPPLPRGLGVPESRDAAISRLFTEAAAAGQRAIAATVSEDVTNPPSCTLVAAVLEDDVVHFCGLGDSRIYLLPDHADGEMLTVDDSMAQVLIAGGMSRAEAEASRQAHSITRWLGKDSVEIVPRVGQVQVSASGWLLACSDGLWNYASEPAALKEQILAAGSDDPLVIARHLVAFANAAGGQDNIAAALARVGESSADIAGPVGNNAASDGGESHG